MQLVEASQSLIDIISRHRDRVIEADLYRDLIETGAVGIIKPDIGYSLLPLTPDQERDVKAMLTECINDSDKESRAFLDRLVTPPEPIKVQSVLEPSEDAEADEEGWVEVETETKPKRHGGKASIISHDLLRECIASGMTIKEIWHEHYPQYKDKSALYRVCRENNITWHHGAVISKAKKKSAQKYTIAEPPAAKARKEAMGEDYKPMTPYYSELKFRCEVCGKRYDYSTFNKRFSGRGKMHNFCSWGCLRKLEIPEEEKQAKKEAEREKKRQAYYKREADRRTERSRELAAERRASNEKT